MRDDKKKVKKRSVSAWWVSITSPGQLPPPPPTMSATAIATSQLSSSWILNQFTTSILQPNLSSNNLTAFIIRLQLSSSWFPDRHHHHRLDFLSFFLDFTCHLLDCHLLGLNINSKLAVIKPNLKFILTCSGSCHLNQNIGLCSFKHKEAQFRIYSDSRWMQSKNCFALRFIRV